MKLKKDNNTMNMVNGKFVEWDDFLKEEDNLSLYDELYYKVLENFMSTCWVDHLDVDLFGEVATYYYRGDISEEQFNTLMGMIDVGDFLT